MFGLDCIVYHVLREEELSILFSGVHWTKSVGAQALKAVWILSSVYGRTLVVSTFSWH